ncbi:MAG: hypothetical protein ACRCVU_05030 [Flavobacterium sp.]
MKTYFYYLAFGVMLSLTILISLIVTLMLLNGSVEPLVVLEAKTVLNTSFIGLGLGSLLQGLVKVVWKN